MSQLFYFLKSIGREFVGGFNACMGRGGLAFQLSELDKIIRDSDFPDHYVVREIKRMGRVYSSQDLEPCVGALQTYRPKIYMNALRQVLDNI